MDTNYLFPTTVKEALQILKKCRGQGLVMAGGTDLMLHIKSGWVNAHTFVDITRIPALTGIKKLKTGFIWVGAATTHRQLWESKLIQTKASVLATACRRVGALQIQNTGTIGGNIVNAMPAADGSIALLALDAEAQIASPGKTRWVKLAKLFAGPGKSTVDSSKEILVGIRFKGTGKKTGSAFQRLARRRALALPMLNCGAVIELNSAGTHIKKASLTLGPVHPVPFRAARAEKLLTGATATIDTFSAAAKIAAEDANPRPSLLRGPTEYRLEMVAVLARRALKAAAAQGRAS